MYEYNAKLERVVDGDTLFANMDLGFNVWLLVEFRLLGINAPEMHGATKSAGLAAKEHLESLLVKGRLIVRSQKPMSKDKYGRYLAAIRVVQHDGSEIDVNALMVADGFAAVY